MNTSFSYPPLLMGGLALFLALACSSSDPDPTSGATSTRSKGRVLVSSETGSSIHVIDLEQAVVETQTKSFSHASEMIISPEGQYALLAQASGNRVDVLKTGSSTAVSTDSSTTENSGHEGHNHKPRMHGDDGHDHDTTTEASSSESSSASSATSSVDKVDLSITGEGLGQVVARGPWMAVQFKNKVVVIKENDLESKLNSISESIVHNIAVNDALPGVPLDDEHIALGNRVFEIEDASLVHSGSNLSANTLVSANILSATRSGEDTALFGTDQGLLVVGKHTESSNTEWVDLMVSYPLLPEVQIFLAEDEHDHDHEGGEEAHGDEHEEVQEHRGITEWATMDGLGHAFAHFTHENHSAGVYRVEGEGLEEDSDLSDVFEYLAGTSNAKERPLAMTLVKLHEEEGEEEHADTTYLLLLMSSGNLRVHDAVNEGAYLRTLDSVIAPVTDLHLGENNLPGLTAGLGKVFVGDPASKQVHQIDLKTFQTELTWSLATSPNRLLLMGESTLGEGSGHIHDHDHE